MTREASSQDIAEAKIDIVYCTDPLCCWSWAFEPQWRKLRYEFGNQINWRYCMGGLLPNWGSYNDPMNSVSRPLQMGPLWFEARYISGMPINERIWMEDPPASSYPACIAVKCAGLQSAAAQDAYLRALREAVMLNSKNIARQTVLLTVADELEERNRGILNIEKFRNDLISGAGQDAFKKDLMETRYHKISRFPSLTISATGGQGVIIVGYRPYKVLLEAIAVVAPWLKRQGPEIGSSAFTRFWERATDREISEAKKAG